MQGEWSIFRTTSILVCLVKTYVKGWSVESVCWSSIFWIPGIPHYSRGLLLISLYMIESWAKYWMNVKSSVYLKRRDWVAMLLLLKPFLIYWGNLKSNYIKHAMTCVNLSFWPCYKLITLIHFVGFIISYLFYRWYLLILMS